MNRKICLLMAMLMAGCATVYENAGENKADSALPPGAPGAPPGGLIPGGGPKTADTSWIKTQYKDVAYASKSDTQKLDLYLPIDPARISFYAA